ARADEFSTVRHVKIDDSLGRVVAGYAFQTPAGWRTATLSLFQTLILAIARISAASSCSSKCLSASPQTSSETGSARSLSRVSASVTAKAARSPSVKYGVSRQAATENSRSSLSPARLATLRCMSTQALQPLIWLAR